MKVREWSKKKKALVLSAVAVLLAGGVLAGVLLGGQGKPVDVISVSQWTLGWMPNQMQLYGSISSDRSQQVYFDKDQTVLRVLVKEGDQVKIGDPLLEYDATLETIEMELKQLKLQQLEYDLADNWKAYKRYARTDYPSTLPSPTPSPTPTPRPTRTPRPTKTPRPTRTPKDTATPTPAGAADTASFGGMGPLGFLNLYPAGAGGFGILFGSADNPDITIEDKKSFSAQEFIGYLETAATSGSAYYIRVEADDYVIAMQVTASNGAVFTPDGGNSLDGSTAAASGSGTASDPYVYDGFAPLGVVRGVKSSFIDARLHDAGENTLYLRLTGDGGQIDMNLRVLEPAPTESPDPSATDTPAPAEPTAKPAGMTREERLALVREYGKKIREAELEYRQLKLDLQNLQLQGADGYIRATIDGVVSKAADPAELSDGELLVAVKGSEGFYVRCIVGELDLDKVTVGTELTGMCYDSGTSCAGRVTEVGTVPVTDSFYSGGNRNVSGYAVRIFIEDGALLQAGQYVEFTLQSGGGEGGGNAMYLYQAFVREIDGVNYIFVARDGRLRREEVTTGKVMYGYVELQGSSLTEGDYIAFPYNKDVRDGAPVNMPDATEAYGG